MEEYRRQGQFSPNSKSDRLLGILIPVVTWLVEKVRKNNSESALCVAGQELEIRSLEKSI